MINRGLPSLAGLAFGSGLALQRCSARPRQLLRHLLLARVYSYRREDLHEDANARLNWWFDLITHKQTWQTMGCMVDHIHLDNDTFNILFQ
jgi:hypothetical protein